MTTAVFPSRPFLSTCVTPGISLHTHPEGEACITMYKCVFFAHRHFFSLPVEGLFSCSRLRGTQGARPNTTAQVWALAEVRCTCSGGSNWQVLSGRDSEHVAPSRCMHTHVQVKRMSDLSCDIWDLECRCRQTLVSW